MSAADIRFTNGSWQSFPFWTACHPKSVTGHVSAGLLSVYLDRGVIPYSEGGGLVHKPADSLDKYQLVEPGDLVMNNQQAWRGSVGVSSHEGIVSPAYLVFSLDKTKIHPGFASYFFRDRLNIDQYMLSSLSVGDIQRQVKWPHLRKVLLNLPDITTQIFLSDLLDRETTRIDTLIQKKTRFIELLKEKRQAVITKAVTKGLDDSVKMKDSGVEWLGQVPEHWEIGRLDGVSRIVRGNSGFSKENLLESGQYVALQYGRTYKVNEINDSFVSYVNQEFFKSNQVAKMGDTILISTSETLEDLGHSCFYNREDIGLIGGEQFLLKPNKEQAVGKYLYFASKVFARYLQKYATGLKVFRFSSDDLKTVCFPKLSQDEQQKIVDFLDRETSRIDTLITKTERSIELLKEKRSALITAAVTGKIDVREAA